MVLAPLSSSGASRTTRNEANPACFAPFLPPASNLRPLFQSVRWARCLFSGPIRAVTALSQIPACSSRNRSCKASSKLWAVQPKNRILLENHCLEGEVEGAIAAFADHCNQRWYHESFGNLNPADVYFGRGETTLADRRRINPQTIQNRRLTHQRQPA